MSTAVKSAAINLTNVTIAYDRHAAVHHLQGSFKPGSLTAIAGPNGAGKSTLLKALMGELTLVSGEIDREGLSIRDFGYLPQAAEIDRSFPINVADTVLLGAWHEMGPFRQVSSATADKARHCLATVGLEGFERRGIGSLSAGQFQRVLFARLLMQDAKIILLDEPFTAIDDRTCKDLLNLIHRWHEDHRTVIAVLHDFDQIRAHFPETLLLAREMIAWDRTDIAMSSENLLRARAMSERWDDGSPLCEGPSHVHSHSGAG